MSDRPLPAVVPPADIDGGARTVSSETGEAGRRVSESNTAGIVGPAQNENEPGGTPGSGDGDGLLPRPSPAAHATGVASAAAGNFLVSEAEDNGEAEPPANGNPAAAGTGTSTNTSQAEGTTPTAIPQEDEAAAVADDDDDADEKESGKNDDEEEEEEEEESDYSYEYDDEDDHYGGFIVEADHPSSAGGAAIPHAVSATASADGDHAASASSEVNTSSGSGSGAAAASGAASSAANGGTGSLLAPVSLAPPREAKKAKKWRDPSREAVNMSLRAEKETTGGKRRLASDLYKIMMNDTAEAGFDIAPKSEDSMDAWTIRLFGFDADSNLSQDLMILGLDHVELEMAFPDQYPFAPPFVRVVRPRFKRQTGFVMNGALCMELLTADGWNPVNDIESVIVSIRSLLVVGDGRLEAAVGLGPEKRKKLLAEAKARALLEEKKGGSDDDDDDDDDEEGSRKRPRDSDASDGADSKKKAKGDDADDGDDDDQDGKKSKNSAISKTAAGSYSTAEAKSAYQHLTDFHKKKGWDQSGWWSKRG